MDRRRAGPRADRPLTSTLTATLEAALVRELRATWRQLNDAYFRSGLVTPTLELVPLRAHAGALDSRHADDRDLAAPRDREAVGCRRRGAQARDGAPVRPRGARRDGARRLTAPPSATPARASASTRALRDALSPASAARRTGLRRPRRGRRRRGEDGRANRAAARARREPEPARGRGGDGRRAAPDAQAQPRRRAHRTPPASTAIAHLGEPTGRVGEHERLVAMILGKHFFVEAIWVPVYRPLEGKRGSVLEICGTPREPRHRRVRPRLSPRNRRALVARPQARHGGSGPTASGAPSSPG